MAELDIVWTSMVVGALIAVPLSTLIALCSDISRTRDIAAAMALQEPEWASEENAPTDDVLWNGDKAYYADVPIEDVEHRIREALDLRRFEGSSKNNLMNAV